MTHLQRRARARALGFGLLVLGDRYSVLEPTTGYVVRDRLTRAELDAFLGRYDADPLGWDDEHEQQQERPDAQGWLDAMLKAGSLSW